MFKCNFSSTPPLTEEYEPTSDTQPYPNEQLQNLGGQDASIIARIKMVRKAMDSLKLRLSVEKNNLARERLETSSMISFESTPSVPLETFQPVGSFHSLPINHHNYNYFDNSNTSYFTGQDYGSSLTRYNYETIHRKEDHRNSRKFNYLMDPVPSGSYREQLEDVEKLCHDEFNKMQESISSLRKIVAQSREYSTDDDSLNSATNLATDKRLVRRHPRNDHNKHHREGHRHRRKRSKYILPDVETVVYEDHNPHSSNYGNNPPKQIYRGRDRIGEYSGDSRDMGVSTLHQQNPYEYYYR